MMDCWTIRYGPLLASVGAMYSDWWLSSEGTTMVVSQPSVPWATSASYCKCLPCSASSNLSDAQGVRPCAPPPYRGLIFGLLMSERRGICLAVGKGVSALKEVLLLSYECQTVNRVRLHKMLYHLPDDGRRVLFVGFGACRSGPPGVKHRSLPPLPSASPRRHPSIATALKVRQHVLDDESMKDSVGALLCIAWFPSDVCVALLVCAQSRALKLSCPSFW